MRIPELGELAASERCASEPYLLCVVDLVAEVIHHSGRVVPGGQHTRPSQKEMPFAFFWKAYLSIKQPLTAHDPIHPQVPSRHEMPFALHFAREQASIGAGPRPARMSPLRPCLLHARCGAFSWFSGLYPAFGRAGVL